MNELYFEGQIVNVHSEDMQYLQDNANSKLLQLLDITVQNGLDSYICFGFGLQISSTDTTKLEISQGTSTGMVVSKSGIIIQTSTGIDLIDLSDSTMGKKNSVYCKCYQTYASYDRQASTIVEEKKLYDVHEYEFVYNRLIDKFSIVVYTDVEYAALSESEKDTLVLLGSTIAQGSGQPLTNVDLSEVKYLSVYIADGSITIQKLQPNFQWPQTMVYNTSTGDVDDHYYGTPSIITDDLNRIRTVIREVKGTIDWNELLLGVRAEITEITKEYKQGTFLEIEDGLLTTLTSSGTALYVRKGSAVVGNFVKRMEEDSVVMLPPRNEHVVGNWATRTDGEYNYVDVAPQTFYLAQTSTGNITVADVHIVRALNPLFEFKAADDPYNPQLGDDYVVFTSTGVVTTLAGGVMQISGILCFYKYYIPRIDTLVITSSGLEIREGIEESHPEPIFITSSGVLPLYHIARSSLVTSADERDVIDVRVPRLEIREVREVYASDLAMYNDQYDFNKLSTYVPYRFSVVHTSTGLLNNMDVWDHNLNNGYDVLMLSSAGIAQTLIHTQKDDEVWLFACNETSYGIEVKLEYATSTGEYDAVAYTTIPRADSLDFVPVGYLLEKGLELGYHKIRISCPDGANTSAWYTSENLNNARMYTAGCGTKASTLSVGGYNGSSIFSNSEKFNGFTWTTDASWNLNTEKNYHTVVGRQNSCLSCGGSSTSTTYSTVTERFNGLTWTVVSTMTTGRKGVAGAGSLHSVMCFGGTTGTVSNKTEYYNGLAWSTLGNLTVARSDLSGCGLKSAALSFGGWTTTYSAATEVFNSGTWAYIGLLNTAVRYLAGCGTQSAALSFGGYTGSVSATTERFDGSNWTINTTWSLNTARSGLGGTGIQSSSLSFGGDTSLVSAVTEKFITRNFQFNKLVVGKLDNYYDRNLSYLNDLEATNIQTDTLYVDGTITSDESILALINADMLQGIHISTDVTLGSNSDSLIPTEKAIKTYIFNTLDALETPVTISYSDELNTISIPYNEDYPSVKLNIKQYQSDIVQNVWTTSPTWNLNIATNGGACCGTIPSAVHFGGATQYNTWVGTTEIFNGITWSNSGLLNTLRNLHMGAGIVNSALASFGDTGSGITNAVEKFNGSYWSNFGSSGTARREVSGCGIQGAALSLGGFTTGAVTTIEKFNGLSWNVSGSVLALARAGAHSAGTATACFCVGSIGYATSVEKYNGFYATAVMLTTAGYLNLGRYHPGCSGTLNAGLVFGGMTASNTFTASTEKYNGFHWSTDSNQTMNSAKNGIGSCGTQNASLSVGGYTFGVSAANSYTAMTEKFIGIVPIKSNLLIQSSTGSIYTTNVTGNFNDKSYDIEVYTPATIQLNSLYNTWQTQEEYDQLSILGLHTLYSNDFWNTAPSLVAVRSAVAGAGTSSAAVCFGGTTTGSEYLTASDIYNGYVWAAQGTLNTGRFYSAGAGTKTAALSFGGMSTGPAVSSITEKFSGTAWTPGFTGLTARVALAGCGTQSAALSFGGSTNTGYTAASAVTEKFNGTNWSSSGSLNISRIWLGGAGVQNSAIAFGGASGGFVWGSTEKFNGSFWSMVVSDTSGTVNFSVIKPAPAGCGTQSSAIAFGGNFTSAAQKFNGLLWSTTTHLNIARYGLAGMGTQSSCLSCGGNTNAAGTTSVSTVENFISNTITNYNFPIRGSWTTSGSWNLNTARYWVAGCGIQSAALCFGGDVSGGSPSRLTEKFNGTAWTQTTPGWDLRSPGKYYHAGCGIQNAALSFGGDTGSISAITEKFDGSVWTYSAVWNLTLARRNLAGCGIQGAALSFGGYTGSVSAVTEKFNGSVWIATGSLNTARYSFAGAGTQSSALSFGGYTGSYSLVTEKFNGTVWAATGSLNIEKYALAGCGTQNSVLSFGGYTGSVTSAITEKFDSAIWSISGSLNTARHALAGCGTQIAALSFGGVVSGASAVTEKYSTISFITTEAWTISGSLNTARCWLGGCGTQSAALSFGGTTGSNTDATEKFNGSTWTNVSTPGLTARSALAGCGIQSAALSFGGFTSGEVATTEIFNGTTWSSKNNMGTSRQLLAGCGDTGAALAFGGWQISSFINVTEKFDGTNWSTSGSWNLNTAADYLAGCGSQTASLKFGGTNGSPLNITEKFNGSSWTTNSSWNLNTARFQLAGCGSQNAALSIGGSPVYLGTSQVTEKFNGAAWFITTNLIVAVGGNASAGITSSAVSFGGFGVTAATEKFSITSTTWTIKKPIVGFWSISNAIMNTPRGYGASFGSQSAGGAAGGATVGTTPSLVTELFNGLTWTASGNLTTPTPGARYITAGCGVQNAGLIFGGNGPLRGTEKFNGSAWTYNASWNLVESTGKQYHSGCGLQNAALEFGGQGVATYSTTAEKFDGSTWSTTGSLNTARQYIAGCGTQGSALSFGGWTGGVVSVTEKFNGATWTVSGVLNLSRYGIAGAGTQTASLAAGGYTGVVSAISEIFNGSVWMGTQSINLARTGPFGFGSQSFATIAGGNYTGTTMTGLTELYNSKEINDYFTPVQGTWTITSDLNTSRYGLAGCGLLDAGLSFGGFDTTYSNVTEKYNGSVWSATGNMTTARRYLAGAGTQSAGLSFGGTTGSASAITGKFDGSTWTTSSSWNLNTPRYSLAGCGTQAAALSFGGITTSTGLATTEIFNGTTWSATGDLTTARYGLSGAGTQSAGLAFGGYTTAYSGTTETFNGSTWTLVSDMLFLRTQHAGSGAQSAALSYTGYNGSYLNLSEKFNGYYWSVTNNANISKSIGAGCGDNSSALTFGGTSDVFLYTGYTEEYTDVKFSISYRV